MLKTVAIALAVLTLTLIVVAGAVLAQSSNPLASPDSLVSPRASVTPSASPSGQNNANVSGSNIPTGAPSTGLGGL